MNKLRMLAFLLELANLASAAPISKADAEGLWTPSKAVELWTKSADAEGLLAPVKAEKLWTREPKSGSNAEALWTPSKAEELWAREPQY